MIKQNIPKSSAHAAVLKELENSKPKCDRKPILQMLLYAFEGLNSININIYPNIIELLSKNNLKSSSLLVDMFSNFKKVSNDNHKWLSKRSFKKSNCCEKNFILCYLLYFYQEYFITYLQNYLLQKKSNEQNVKSLISSLRKILVTYLKNNYNMTSINSNIHEKNQKSMNQENTSQEPNNQGNKNQDQNNLNSICKKPKDDVEELFYDLEDDDEYFVVDDDFTNFYNGDMDYFESGNDIESDNNIEFDNGTNFLY